MLVVVEDGDVTALLELALDLKAAGSGNILQIHAAERAGDECDGIDEFVHIMRPDAQWECVHIAEGLEEHALALHDRHTGLRADIAQTQQTGTLQPSLTIENAEKLTATFYCNRPTEQPITLTIQLSDGISTYTKKLAQSQLYQQGSRLYRYTWVLDDLTRDSTRFYAQTGGNCCAAYPSP